jgi:ABC-type glycerol-3-phosphate transport system substrate-binding protein
MRRMLRVVVAALLAVTLLGACSAEGGVDTSGDGVKIEGDVDAKNP